MLKPTKCVAERGADLHQLKAGLDLLDEHVDLDRPGREPEVPLERRKDVVPQRRLLGSLDLREVEDDGPALGLQPLAVVHDVEHDVDDRSGEAGPVGFAHVTVVEVQPPRAEDPGGEVELLAPVVEDRTAEEAPRPAVHLVGDVLRDAQENRVPVEGELEIALVVERHRVDLSEGVLAVEHPPVGAGEQRVRDVAQAALGRGARPGGGPRSLDPLALEVGRDLAAGEAAFAGIAHTEVGARNERVGFEKTESASLEGPLAPPRAALGHDPASVPIERRQRRERRLRRRRINVGISGEQTVTELEAVGHCGPPCRPNSTELHPGNRHVRLVIDSVVDPA